MPPKADSRGTPTEKMNWDLVMAGQHGDLSALQELLSKRAEVNAKDTTYGRTALHLASDGGHLECLEELMGKNADIDSKSDAGSTALHNASIRGHLECLEELLGKNADIDSKAISGDTALHRAAANGKLECLEELCHKGADRELKGNQGRTALDIARQGRRPQHPAIVEFLEDRNLTNASEAGEQNGIAVDIEVVGVSYDLLEQNPDLTSLFKEEVKSIFNDIPALSGCSMRTELSSGSVKVKVLIIQLVDCGSQKIKTSWLGAALSSIKSKAEAMQDNLLGKIKAIPGIERVRDGAVAIGIKVTCVAMACPHAFSLSRMHPSE